MPAVVKVAVCPTQAVKSVGWVVMVMLGVEPTVKTLLLVAVLHPKVTEIVPVVAPTGTVVVILVEVLAVTTAAVPLNFTMLFAGVASKLVPAMVTELPIAPEVGAKEVIVGTRPLENASPVMAHPLAPIKFVLAETADGRYSNPMAPSVMPLGVEGLAFQPISVAE